MLTRALVALALGPSSAACGASPVDHAVAATVAACDEAEMRARSPSEARCFEAACDAVLRRLDPEGYAAELAPDGGSE